MRKEITEITCDVCKKVIDKPIQLNEIDICYTCMGEYISKVGIVSYSDIKKYLGVIKYKGVKNILP